MGAMMVKSKMRFGGSRGGFGAFSPPGDDVIVRPKKPNSPGNFPKGKRSGDSGVNRPKNAALPHQASSFQPSTTTTTTKVFGMMKNLSGLPLDDDILDRVLMFSPTFEDLYATILSSKSFHAVYNAYPHSIIRNVAYNVAGPALPQAVRLVRYELAHSDDSDHDDDGSDTESESSDATPRDPGEETTDISPLTTPEIYALRKVAAVAKGLEDLFSMRYCVRYSYVNTRSNGDALPFIGTRIEHRRPACSRHPSPGVSVALCIESCCIPADFLGMSFLIQIVIGLSTKTRRTTMPISQGYRKKGKQERYFSKIMSPRSSLKYTALSSSLVTQLNGSRESTVAVTQVCLSTLSRFASIVT